MMRVEFEQYEALPCCAKTFTINGRNARIDDFGASIRHNVIGSQDEIDVYGCRDREWFRYTQDDIVEEAMSKYDINPYEHDEICAMLEQKLNIGNCGWCI